MGSTWGFLDNGGAPLAFAHRGAHRPEGPGENTMAAYAAAVDLGYRYIETDVHLTADGVVVAFHDDHLDRVTDMTGAISDHTWEEVSRAKVGAEGDPVPRLDELLTTWPDVQVNIDPKHDRVVDALARLLTAHDAVGRVCCGSFSDKRLVRLRSLLGADLCTSLGPKATAKLLAASKGAPVRSLPGPCAQLPAEVKGRPLVTEKLVATAHRLGLQVHVWTIDDPAEMTRLLDLGVDGLMTDDAVALKQVLLDRDEWT